MSVTSSQPGPERASHIVESELTDGAHPGSVERM